MLVQVPVNPYMYLRRRFVVKELEQEFSSCHLSKLSFYQISFVICGADVVNKLLLASAILLFPPPSRSKLAVPL